MLLKKNNYEYDITFICRKGECHFAQPILNELEKKYKIQYIFPNHKIEYWHFMVKGKVIWVEWANKFALEVSKKNWKDKKVIVRFHRNEILSEYMSKIKWQNIDKVIFVNSQFEKEFKDKITKNVDTVMIPNAIETKSFPFYKHNYGHSICVYGYAFNPIKGYDLLINMFNKLLKFNPKFHLTIMGMLTGQPSSVRHLKVIKKQIKTLNLAEKITIIEKKKVDSLVEDRKNVSEFLSKHDIIMSYSNTESFHYSFAEGMLSGLEGFYNMWHNPLIKEFWEDFGYESEDKLIAAILEWEKLNNKEKIIKAKKNREYILNNFSNTSISKVYEDLFFYKDVK
jgi:glycosyltransferase involved in cell wall biosynthesis